MHPVALERALAILRHAKQLGGKLDQFTVSVTAAEGFELIRWFRAQATPETTDLAIFDADIKTAVDMDDPWFVLCHFELLGLKITRRLH
jgi:hypothetical protein